MHGDVRVLFVSEEPDLAAVLSELLAYERAELRHVRSVAAALAVLDGAEAAHVILVDGSAHGIRERGLLGALKRLPVVPPVVVLSDVTREQASGLDDAIVLLKPVKADDVIAAIRIAARKGARQRERGAPLPR